MSSTYSAPPDACNFADTFGIDLVRGNFDGCSSNLSYSEPWLIGRGIDRDADNSRLEDTFSRRTKR